MGVTGWVMAVLGVGTLPPPAVTVGALLPLLSVVAVVVAVVGTSILTGCGAAGAGCGCLLGVIGWVLGVGTLPPPAVTVGTSVFMAAAIG